MNNLTHPTYIKARDLILKSEGRTIEDEFEIKILKRAYTGYWDINGEKIHYGDCLEFHSYDGAIWIGEVIYEDAIATVGILNKKNVKNPKDWNQNHDWIESRWWGTDVGYGELGSWNCDRKTLSQIAGHFKSSDEMFKVRAKFNDRYGACASNDDLQREIPVKKVEKPEEFSNGDYEKTIKASIPKEISLDRVLMALKRGIVVAGKLQLENVFVDEEKIVIQTFDLDREFEWEIEKPLHLQSEKVWEKIVEILKNFMSSTSNVYFKN